MITSPENKTFKFLKSLAKGKYRRERGLFPAEGLRLVRDLYEAGLRPKFVAVTPGFSQDPAAKELLSRVEEDALILLAEELFAQLAETVNPQGIYAAFPIPSWQPHQIWERGLGGRSYVLCLDGLQDPGNLGTIIRTCGAFGFSLVLGKGTVDPFNPKVVRASMGALAKVPMLRNVDLVSFLQNLPPGLPVYATAPAGDYSLGEADTSQGCVIVVGNEANGLSREVVDITGRTFFIPMVEGAESLNAASATAILLYESVRDHLYGATGLL
ncbi:MAG: RNA methyltransferase [Firmicutes bacterium]|nr:RNA methyltransferase [Bacillota bacterium]